MDEYLRCDSCGHVFSTKFNLKRHKTTILACAEVEMVYICVCGHEDVAKYNYNKHIANCAIYDYNNQLKEKDAQIQELNLERNLQIEQIGREKDHEIEQLNQEKDNKIQELNDEMDGKDLELIKLKKKITELKKENMDLKLLAADKGARIDMYKTMPATNQTTNTTKNIQYVNSKLLKVKCDTIRPFTVETIKEEVAKDSYSYDHFERGIKGLADFISGMTILDDQSSYTCTDAARNKFHRLLETREWKDDNGAVFLNTVFDELKDVAQIHYDVLTGKALHAPEDGEEDEREYYDVIWTKSKPIFEALRSNKSKHREPVLDKVRTEVKKLASI
jgi:hypothetical protein